MLKKILGWLSFDDEVCVIIGNTHFWVNLKRDKDV